jgi:hypothetical protein
MLQWSLHLHGNCSWKAFFLALSGTTPKLHAMEEDIALPEREATKKTARIDALRSGYEAANILRIQESDKWISWSPVTEVSSIQGSYDGAPPLHLRGTPHAALGKQGKLAAWLATAEWDSVATNACINALQSDLEGPNKTAPAQDALPWHESDDHLDGTSFLSDPSPARDTLIWESLPPQAGSDAYFNIVVVPSASPATTASTPRSCISQEDEQSQMHGRGKTISEANTLDTYMTDTQND